MPGQRRHLGGLGGPSPPQGKRKKEKKKEKKKKEKKREKKRKRKKGTMNDVKLLHIKCCFFPIFQWSGGIKKSKIFLPPPRKS